MPRATAWRSLTPALLAALCLAACAGRPAATPGPGQEARPEAATAEPDWAALAARRLPLLEPCQVPDVQETLLCGTLEVPEDRAAPHGRRLGLEVVVVPARAVQPPPDPVFIFEGGPGGAATGRAAGSVHAGPVRSRDIVLVDQRGTGGSNPLHCAWDEQFRPGELRQIFPPEAVRTCAAELADRADLARYTSEHFADDIEEVRRRLGYGPINIRGGSYGTWAMMVFAQRHPESTRTLFGIGVDSPLRSNLAERGVWTDRTLARLAARCAAEEACAAVAPDLAAMTAEVVGRLADGPRRVEIPDPARPEETLALDLGRDWLAEQLRLILYFAYTSRALPWAVHRVHAADDWGPLATLAVLIERTFRGSLAYGLILTVQCSELMDFDVEEALARGAGTLVGNYRLEQQLQGCAAWPHDKRPALGVAAPRPLPIPALFVSGALDPVTPPEYAEEAATLFPESLHLVLEEGQHGPFDLANSWPCIHQIWAELLDRGSVQGLDVACARTLHRPPFLVDGESFGGYVRETLVPMSG